MNCLDCLWKNAETCRACKIEVSMKGLTEPEQDRLKYLSSVLTDMNGRVDMLTESERLELHTLITRRNYVQTTS